MAWTERYVNPTGSGAHDGTTPADAWSLAEAIAAYAAGHRVNVLNGTYANTTTGRTFGTAGTTTAPIWWRGYNTTPGDIDSNNSLTKPSITFTTGLLTISASHQYFSGLSVQSARSGAAISITGAISAVRLRRLRVENTSSNSAAACITDGAGSQFFAEYCWFKCPSATSTTNMIVVNGSGVLTGFKRCVFEGGFVGLLLATSRRVHGCIFFGQASHAISTAATGLITGNTFYSIAGDAIRVTSVPNPLSIEDNIFDTITGIGINQNTGTNTNLIGRSSNLFHACSGGNEVGFGNAPSFDEQADSASPFVLAGSDFTLVSSSNGYQRAMLAAFENLGTTNYESIGAVVARAGGGTFPVLTYGQQGALQAG